MPRTMQAIVDHDDELADYFEQLDPDDLTDVPVDVEMERRLAQAARGRARTEREIADAVEAARQYGLSWRRIGEMLGTSAQAAQKRYGGTAPTTRY